MEIWDEIGAEFNQEIDRLRNTLGAGLAEDFCHYRQVVGSIQGIEWAKQQILDLHEKINKEDD